MCFQNREIWLQNWTKRRLNEDTTAVEVLSEIDNPINSKAQKGTYIYILYIYTLFECT